MEANYSNPGSCQFAQLLACPFAQVSWSCWLWVDPRSRSNHLGNRGSVDYHLTTESFYDASSSANLEAIASWRDSPPSFSLLFATASNQSTSRISYRPTIGLSPSIGYHEIEAISTVSWHRSEFDFFGFQQLLFQFLCSTCTSLYRFQNLGLCHLWLGLRKWSCWEASRTEAHQDLEHLHR